MFNIKINSDILFNSLSNDILWDIYTLSNFEFKGNKLIFLDLEYELE